MLISYDVKAKTSTQSFATKSHAQAYRWERLRGGSPAPKPSKR